MGWGSVSDWVTAIANAGLAGAAIFAARVGIQSLNAWQKETIGKRKAELAEQALVCIYEVRDVLKFVRIPATLSGEGESRQSDEPESEKVSGARMSYSIPIARLQREKELFAKLQSLRYSFAALFGSSSAQAFDDIREIQIKIFTAASTLAMAPQIGVTGQSDASITELRNPLGWCSGERPDVIDKKIEGAVEALEAICRPILSEPPPDARKHLGAGSRSFKWSRKE